ncbi:hypothetical protein K456DRAFT_916197 [Colletotrichum gloeosporioides 23]|nr:hypothetical protein K456DRAFT_916197 [Colletotrichum gloeosporioides 23]
MSSRGRVKNEDKGALRLGMSASVSHGIVGVFLAVLTGAVQASPSNATACHLDYGTACMAVASVFSPGSGRWLSRRRRGAVWSGGRNDQGPGLVGRMGVRRQDETARLRRVGKAVGNMTTLSVEGLAQHKVEQKIHGDA